MADTTAGTSTVNPTIHGPSERTNVPPEGGVAENSACITKVRIMIKPMSQPIDTTVTAGTATPRGRLGRKDNRSAFGFFELAGSGAMMLPIIDRASTKATMRKVTVQPARAATSSAMKPEMKPADL